MATRRAWLLLVVGLIVCLSSPSNAMAAAARSCRICTAKTCKRNGSGFLLEAMKSLAPSDVEVKAERCLNICAPRGIVVRSSPSGKSKTLKVILDNKATAMAEAKKLLRDMN